MKLLLVTCEIKENTVFSERDLTNVSKLAVLQQILCSGTLLNTLLIITKLIVNNRCRPIVVVVV